MEANVGAKNSQSETPRDLALARRADAGSRIPQSVNLHLTAVCNRTCRFCYQTKEGLVASLTPDNRRPLDRTEWLELQGLLAAARVERITYAGGEPTLVPYLAHLVLDWHRLKGRDGPRAMLVTNGTGLSCSLVQRLRPALAAVKLSFESASDANAVALGRGRGNHLEMIIERADMLHELGVGVHLNSVITAKNLHEDLSSLVDRVRPSVWKIFQFLPVPGENDAQTSELAITREEFQGFLVRHTRFRGIWAPE